MAHRVWAALGDVKNYVEPFCGSCAVLLSRPGGAGPIETVNDADGLLSNFWRALKHDPDAVAAATDWPVNEADLHARHLWLLGERQRITERLMGDPDWFDAKAAGWWVWGQCCWIGSGWCSGEGSWISRDGVMVKAEADDLKQGVNRKMPHLGDPGKGVNRQMPHLGNPGKGVNRQMPHLGNPGKGVNRQMPHLGDPGMGVNRQMPHLGDPGKGECERRAEWLRGYLREFADRLRNVRVCCGDWSRVCGPSVTFRHGLTGVFLDPPYSDLAKRRKGVYAEDCERVAHDVREWAIEQGRNPLMRIALAGYEGEHEMPPDWRVEHWKARGGYGRIGKSHEGTGRMNRLRERLWFSPACLTPEPEGELQPDLFEVPPA